MAQQPQNGDDHGMDLEEFRLAEGLSYRGLAALIGASHASKIRAWALGEARPEADQMEAIVQKTRGSVTIEAMHKRRLAWLKEQNRCTVSTDCDARSSVSSVIGVSKPAVDWRKSPDEGR